MNKTYLVALSSAVVSCAVLGGILVVPAHAASAACSGGGTFTRSGTVVTSSSFNCSGTVAIPSDITEIGPDAFANRGDLTAVTFAAESSLTVIRDSAFEATALTSVAIPDTVTTIEAEGFGLVPSLQTLTFGSGSLLTTLGAKAFFRSGVQTVTFPAGLNSLGNEAFSESSSLATVRFLGTSAPATVGTNVFLSIAASPQLNLQTGATGFGSVGDSWNGLIIASGGTIIPEAPAPDPAPGAGSIPAFTPPPPPPVLR